MRKENYKRGREGERKRQKRKDGNLIGIVLYEQPPPPVAQKLNTNVSIVTVLTKYHTPLKALKEFGSRCCTSYATYKPYLSCVQI